MAVEAGEMTGNKAREHSRELWEIMDVCCVPLQDHTHP